jgi:metaxin
LKLYNLYVDNPNFKFVAIPLYIDPSTSSSVARLSLSHSLRSAATAELLKFSRLIDPQAIYSEASKAFEALSTLLGENEWFFNQEGPGLFDASVFAYTHLLLDNQIGWKNNELGEALSKRGNLVRHRERILRGWYQDEVKPRGSYDLR